MTNPKCPRCGGKGEYRIKEKRKFRVQDSKTKEWSDEEGEVWVDVRCNC